MTPETTDWTDLTDSHGFSIFLKIDFQKNQCKSVKSVQSVVYGVVQAAL
jgi:hypothetical protein